MSDTPTFNNILAAAAVCSVGSLRARAVGRVYPAWVFELRHEALGGAGGFWASVVEWHPHHPQGPALWQEGEGWTMGATEGDLATALVHRCPPFAHTMGRQLGAGRVAGEVYA